MILFSTSCYPQNPCPELDSIKYGGKWYHTVQIGSQCWLKENLNVGTIVKIEKKQKNNGIIEKYCIDYDTDNNCEEFGGFYQWNEAMQYSKKTVNVKGICPKGWNIPTSYEIDTLIKTVNNDGKTLTANEGGTNTSGFSDFGRFECVEYSWYEKRNVFLVNAAFFGYFWSSTSKDTKHAIYFCLQKHSDYSSSPILIRQLIGEKNDGLPIRCLKDNY